MPVLKLRKHQSNFSDEDILINQSDYPALKLNDVVELKPSKDPEPANRILLQVRKWPDNNIYPNAVSIKDSIATNHIKPFADVAVNIVDKKNVLVDSIEICFSNAYLARSYMWGLRKHLNRKCVYQRQKLDYLNIRSQLCEIWAQGNKMSSEMWDYDINGDLYCEKAINGFLKDLFERWRENDCSHDITIVLFSRTYYDANDLSEFPQEMRECLQLDCKNRFYEDCYRVAFQNDRFDLHDWNAKLTQLKSLFNQYQKEVIDRHQNKYQTIIPRAYNSSAAQGNFLEVLNMSLNVFEKHYFDRSFDRTGQLSVVVSPGVGVFEVDFEMTNLTKQRIIDNGIGSDLVCLGEQPLHTVPLLKFNSKSHPDDSLNSCDVYNVPHWINLSFYSSQNQDYYYNFVPRIKLPTIHSSNRLMNSHSSSKCQVSDPIRTPILASAAPAPAAAPPPTTTTPSTAISNGPEVTSNFINQQTMPDLVDYDDYDSHVFKAKSLNLYHHCQQIGGQGRNDRSILCDIDSNADSLLDSDDDFMERGKRKSTGIHRRLSDVKNYQEYSRNIVRQQGCENLSIINHHSSRVSPQIQTPFNRMSLVDSYLSDVKIKPESVDDLSVRGYNMQSSRINKTTTRPKALINPFDPSHMTIKLTPNRRRWTHVFPQGPTGTFIQQHHYQPISGQKLGGQPYLANISHTSIAENEVLHLRQSLSSSLFANQQLAPSANPQTGRDKFGQVRSQQQQSELKSSSKTLSGITATGSPVQKSTLVSNETVRFAWCASGEQEWTPAITTGVDWKSLIMPACLPLTTDFFPSKTSLQNDYVIGEYNIDSGCIHPRYKLIEVYRELVCQRLQKGFQIILLPRNSDLEGVGGGGGGGSGGGSGTSKVATASIKKMSSSSGRPSRQNSTTRSGSSMSARPSLDKNSVGGVDDDNGELEKERTEYTLSIGRIFHKLKLNGNTITVTIYRPRHPYDTIKIDYCYRFRAPFHETYGQSWVHFKSEKLENYSWNYLDNYICARGENFELRSSLKFWRFRILILPSNLNLNKIIHNHSQDGSTAASGNQTRHDVHYLTFSDDERSALMESFVKLLEIINKTRRSSACRLSTGNAGFGAAPSDQLHASSEQALSARLKVHIDTDLCLVSCASSSSKAVGRFDSQQAMDSTTTAAALASGDAGKLTLESLNMDIDSALRAAERAEWVHVQHHCYYKIDQAFELVIKWMVASGAGIAEMVQAWSRKAGTCSSVHLVPIPWEPFALPHTGKADPLRCPIGMQLYLEALPFDEGRLLEDCQVIDFMGMILRRFGFVTFHDLISTENIERQFVHSSGFAFVALPNLNGSPQQGHNNSNSSNQDDSDNQRQKQQHLTEKQATASETAGSGGVKPAIASAKTAATDGAANKGFKPEHQEIINSPHEEYITRHISGTRQNKTSRLRADNGQIEFLWSWNYMLTKRWRSPSTQDESYAVSLMQDFKSFCMNGDNRLVEFWEQIRTSL